MKKSTGFLSLLVFIGITTMSFVNLPKINPHLCLKNTKSELISFNVKGNGKYYVELGVADKPGGIGSCCRQVGLNSTVGFQGHVGDVLYDTQTRKIITKIYLEIKGTTIDLKEYY